ncbi:MAG: alanine--tRNA ligase [Candidatus Methanomethylicaceae archaeon]
MIAGPEAYRLQFFLDNGFTRKECKLCKRNFWTLDPDRDICGDSPCAPYSFINHPPTRRPFNIKEMREAFLSFFEERGHTRVRRYPVVARWREDIFLTIASIACFQPHVTSGEVPPPFNPLTISQPCIRMNDLDNVGKTGGRHLTIFEMMAHHAFSSDEREIYWKEDTVAYHHEFLTNDLGIPGEEITYIEHWWEGGGDAGPDLEGIVRGLELSTLVFMQYKKVGESYKELPLRIVDTGYGLERFTWISQGTPTAFEAVYGCLFEDFLKLSGLERPDPKILSEATRFTGLMNIVDEGSIKATRERVAKALGLDALSLESQLRPIETIMAILDHTKTIAFMLGDGVVPSNVQSGYLARLMIRRVKRMMDYLRISLPLSELLAMQASYWKDQFPELADNLDYISHVSDLEVRRYIKTIDQGKSLVLRIIKDEEIRRRGVLPLELLIQLYDSNGLPPEVVKEVSEPNGVMVNIPHTFDTMVAEMHASSAQPKKKEEDDILKDLPTLPTTELVYYSEPKARRLEARVLYSDRKRVILDRTIFYPEGGGQLSDMGSLIVNGREVKVINVQKSRGIVVHFIEETEPLDVGTPVECLVDWERRSALARHHSSTHILLGAARRVLGEHVWQEGAQKSVEKSRLDISHFEKISPSQLREIEVLVNRIVQECRPIRTYFEDRNKAEQRFGMRLYQGGVIYGSKIRVVEIEDWDAEACGGIHCSNTGEIGLIKIIRSERIQDGVERIEFVSGEQAIRFIHSRESILQEVSKILNTPVERVEKAVTKLMEDFSNSKKCLDRLRRALAQRLSADLYSTAETIGGITFIKGVIGDLSTEDLLSIASYITEKKTDALVILVSSADGSVVSMAGEEAVKKGAHAGKVAEVLTKSLGGKGGGRPDVGQGRIPLEGLDYFTSAVQQIKNIIEGLNRVKGN